MINCIFRERKEKVGILQLKMLIHNRFKVRMNKKKIARLKKKYQLTTKIRKKNNFRKFANKKHEHQTCPNIVNREFKRKKINEVYSTDITQLNYGKNSKAYLAVFKDLASREIVSSSISRNIDLRLVNEALDSALEKLTHKDKKNLIIHSDQGFHFTHFKYREKLKKNGVTQSMSRRGNCLDNAPVESFFGYIKDHLELKECDSFKKLEKMVTREIDYYNNVRPQWDLREMPPAKFRRHLF